MTIIKHDRLFPNYKVQQDGGAEKTLKGHQKNIDSYFEIELDGLSENNRSDIDFSRELNFRWPSKKITNKNFIYSFVNSACLEDFTQIGISLDIYQKIEKQSNQKETIEFKVSDIDIFKEYVSSIPKNSTSIEVSDVRGLVSYMRLNLAQIGDDPFVQSVNIFINKLLKVDRSLLSRMATDDDADPFSQNKNYIGYFSKSSLE
ncbi:hypothetical protein ACTFIR_003906 [Dictyostelium discoideum]